MFRAVLERLELRADLERALGRGELALEYQPIVVLDGGAIAGFEALLRWRNPGRGHLPPADFIPMAEETGLIIPIGQWVLRRACADARSWARAARGGPPPDVSLNISARQLQQSKIVDDVGAALRASGLDPERLILEITESVLMQDTETAIQRLGALKALGVRIAVDDFGTGYSSLNYLSRFPIDIIKIDKSFVDGIATGGEGTAVPRAIVQLARSLRLQTVAEGIERADQLRRLVAMGCRMGQGFLLGEPLDAKNVAEVLEKRPARPSSVPAG
jgi:EAL domain-containing protein (putative c-di-GMP-specific phosphodiesterase class I)